MSGGFLGNVWGMSREYLGDVWGVSGECLGSIWRVSGGCLEGYLGMFLGECLDVVWRGVWRLSRGCLEGCLGVSGSVLGVCGECLGDVWGVVCTMFGVNLIYLEALLGSLRYFQLFLYVLGNLSRRMFLLKLLFWVPVSITAGS